MKLALGTVQFGIPYGVANKGSQVKREEAANILAYAREAGIDTLDTAISYGTSEQCLGEAGINGYKIITKVPVLPAEIGEIYGWLANEVEGSMERMNVTSLYGVLLHHSNDLLSRRGRELSRAMIRLKREGSVKKIGVSVYSPTELEGVLSTLDVDLVQAPLNLVDRRLITSGWLQRLHERAIEIHTRSAFLQGLLLMPRNAIPPRFERWDELWDSWHRVLGEAQMTAVSACLKYPLSFTEIDRVVIGVENREQLHQAVVVAGSHCPTRDWSMLESEDEKLINPTNWASL